MTTATEEIVEGTLASIRYAAGTDVGMRREENQDSYGIIESSEYRFYIVADGMGGVKGGAVASNLAITTVEKSFQGISKGSPEAILAAVASANAEIYKKGSSDPALSGMGTTFVGLFFAGTSLHVVNVGDSRAYRIRGNVIEQLTEDHTLVRELMRQGAITEEQAEHHPVAHMLTRSLGPTPEVIADCVISKDGPVRGDRYLLCSDGLYNLVKDHEILTLVTDYSPDDAIQKLIDLANGRGGTDNITVLVVEVGADYPVGIEDITVIADEEPLESDAVSPAPVSEEPPVVHVEQPEPEEPYLNGHNHAAPDPYARERGKIHEDESEGEEEGDEPEPRRRTFSLARYLFHISLGVVGGVAITYAVLGRHSNLPASTTTTLRGVPKVVERGSTSHSAPELKQENSPLRDPALTETVPGVTSGMHLAGGHYSDADRLGPQERASVQKRKEELSSLIATLDEKLSRFDKPLSGEIASILSESSKKSTELNEKLESIRAEVDAATRRLAVWYGRRKRLEISDPVNMASEVSVSSEEVRGRKEAFEKATWEYLKEVEALRYNPGDKERVQRVEELIRIRTDRSRELAVSVRAAIDKSVTDADHAIAELTLERDRVEVELESVKSEEDVVKILMGTDDAAKETIKNDLRRRREGALSELEELKRLLPE